MAASSSRDDRYERERLALEDLSGVLNQTGESVHNYTARGRYQLDIVPDTTVQITADIHVSTTLSLEDPDILSAITGTDLIERLRALPLRRWAALVDILLVDERERYRQYKNLIFQRRLEAREEALEALHLEQARLRLRQVDWRARVLAILHKGKAHQEGLVAT